MNKMQKSLLPYAIAFYAYRAATAPFRLVGKGIEKVGRLFGRARSAEGDRYINIGSEFDDYLTGRRSAIYFRMRLFFDLDFDDWWASPSTITLDFSEVKTLSPAWVDEFLERFAVNCSIASIREKIRFVGLCQVKLATVEYVFAELEKAERASKEGA